MTTRTTKLATSLAMVLGLAVIGIVLHKSAPAAYGLARVIDAYTRVRSLHVKSFHSGRETPNEFWIVSDQSGRVVKARYYLPQTEDGAKLITWTAERTELWFQTKRSYVTLQTRRIQPWMQELLEECQPQLHLQQLLKAKNAGNVDLRIEEPDKNTVLLIAVNKPEQRKEVCRIDRGTDLIRQIEVYRMNGENEVLNSTTEFSDYNAPFDPQLFSIRESLPPGTRIADHINQLIGVAQGGLNDEQAAAETARQFFNALLTKDYKTAGLIVCGELEEYARAEYGKLNVTAVLSVGPAVPQPNWDKRGYKVPCQIELTYPDGRKTAWTPGVYVRPGDDEMHPDRWNITGGINTSDALVTLLPDNAKYSAMSPKEAASAFLQACAEENWDEVVKFSPLPAGDDRLQRLKDYLGGLQVISIGEPFKKDRYPGWYVPYEIKLRPQDFLLRLSKSDAAKRWVITAMCSTNQSPLQEWKWTTQPEALPATDPVANLAPAELAKAYFNALSQLNWDQLSKFCPPADLDQTKRRVEEAQQRGVDMHTLFPVVEVGETFSSPDNAAIFVKCRATHLKKWNLAIRNDNPARRFLWDGGL